MATAISQGAANRTAGNAATGPRAGIDMRRVMVATDRSETADWAVRWAANLAGTWDAELFVLQVVVPPSDASVDQDDLKRKQSGLEEFVTGLGETRSTGVVVIHADPAQAILEAATRFGVDLLVVGNVGMSGRKSFLLGNIPNRISHNARCNIVIVNTVDLVTAQLRSAAAAHSAEPRAEDALFARAVRISRILGIAGMREFMRLRHSQDDQAMASAARRLRETLDELGPTFAKLGQILSTRPDLVPPAFVKELASLQEQVTPLTEEEVVSVMEEELGVPWEDLFDSIDPEPLAAGTIAQVHRATLDNGERVVVKVQRPTAERDILKDLGLLEMFAGKAARRPALNTVFDIPAIVEHLSSSLRRELDFKQEASNLRRMKKVLAPFPRVDVPCVYEEYSTRRLLVIEEIAGVPVQHAPAGRERSEAARQLIEAFCHQILIDGFFHADPHPGNMKWLNGTVYLLDLGMVGELDDSIRNLMVLIMLAFAEKDTSFLAETVLSLSGMRSTADIDYEAFVRDMDEMINQYRDLPIRDIQLGPVFQQMTRTAVRHGVPMPAALALTSKSLAQMQLAAAQMDPTLDPFSVAESYIMRSMVQHIARGMTPKKLFYESQKVGTRLAHVLESVEGVVGAGPGERLQVNFRGAEHLEQSINRASRVLMLGFVVSGLLGGVGSAVATLLLRHRLRAD